MLPKFIPTARKSAQDDAERHDSRRIVAIWPARWRWIAAVLSLATVAGLAWFFRFTFFQDNGWNYRFDRWTQTTEILDPGTGWKPLEK